MSVSTLLSRFAIVSTIVASGALAACATTNPPHELIDARAAYAQAAASPAPNLVPADLHVARESLDTAEHAYDQHPDAQDTADLAYIAMRSAQRAEALAYTAKAVAQRDHAERDVGKTQAQIIADRDAKLKDTQGALAQERDSLDKQKELTAAERAARLDAEKKAHDAMDALAKNLAVKADPRGTVITLSGGVLFATGQATILPGAQAELDQVAGALKTQAEHHFTVEGHTDNQGTDRINDELSRRRAEAVRDYLVVHGVAADAITAQGFGSTRPVGENKTSEGRAMNRRVEIIVDKGSQVSTTP